MDQIIGYKKEMYCAYTCISYISNDTFAGRLHPGCCINGVSEQAISRHFISDDSSNNFPYKKEEKDYNIRAVVLIFKKGLFFKYCKCIYAKPVWIPARMVIVLGAMSGLTTAPQAAFRSNAILQISAACLKYAMKRIGIVRMLVQL